MNINGTHYVLAAVRELRPNCRFYFAGSSEMFGNVNEVPQKESTSFQPRSPYGISKVAGFHLTRNYREAYGLHCVSGILFNHESPRRGFEFVSRKTTSTVARIKLGLASELTPQSQPSEAFTLPVIGEIAAGGPIEAYQDASETLAVPDILAPAGDAYVLRVRGDSMIEAHIADGDFVVIRPQETARDGDIVVAQVEENAVTLKRFFKEKDRVRLQPANPAYPAQFYDDVRIQGKLNGVIRRLDCPRAPSTRFPHAAHRAAEFGGRTSGTSPYRAHRRSRDTRGDTACSDSSRCP
jgi:SOS regulatory protein LexA